MPRRDDAFPADPDGADDEMDVEPLGRADTALTEPDDRAPDDGDDDAPSRTAPALKELTAIIAKGAPPGRCREAVLAHHNRWRTDLGKEEADQLMAELRDALAEGLEQAEQGAAEFDGDPKEKGAFTRTMNAQLAGMRSALDAATAAAG